VRANKCRENPCQGCEKGMGGMLFIVSSCLVAQDQLSISTAINDPTVNYLQVRDSLREWLSAHPDEENEEGGLSGDLTKWEWFWANRIGGVQSLPGQMDVYREAIAAFSTTPICDGIGFNPQPWTELGPTSNLPGTAKSNLGIVNCVAVTPGDRNDMFIGCRSSGIWHTSNALSGSPTWLCVTDGLHVPGIGVVDIKIAPSDPTIMYATTGAGRGGTSFGCGIIRSYDHGSNWEVASPIEPGPFSVQAYQLAIDPSDPYTVYALLGTSVYKTTDSGDQWEMLIDLEDIESTVGDNPSFPNSPVRLCKQILFHPADPNTLYMSTDDDQHAVSHNNNDGAQMWVTHDAGATWTEILPVGTGTGAVGLIPIAVCPLLGQEDNLWAIISGQLWKSTDQGASWLAVNNGVPGLCLLAISPLDPLVMYAARWTSFQHDLMKSTDGGLTFNENQGTAEHADVRFIQAFSNTFVVQGNDGGVACTIMGGGATGWTNLNGSALGIHEYYGIAVNELSTSVIGGAQDNAVSVHDFGGWHQITLSQDGGNSVSSRTDPNLMYAQKWCCQENGSTDNLFVYNFDGTSWSGNNNSTFPHQLPAVSVMVMGDDDHIYNGHHDVFRGTPISVSPWVNWTQISDFTANFGSGTSKWVSALASAPSQPNIIYAALSAQSWSWTTLNPQFFKTTTGGGTGSGDWLDLTPYFPASIPAWLGITAMTIDPKDPDRIWIGCGGFAVEEGLSAPYNGKERVFMSEDGGLSWVDYSTGLPGLVINDLVYQRGSNDALYVGTDVGVFYRNAGLSEWKCFNNGLPTVIALDLDIDYCAEKIYASCHGRGIWLTDLVESSAERVIEANTTFTGTQYLASDLRVTDGHTLTVTGTVKCYNDVRIIVEPHARLLIDGGLITTQCPDQRWKGVEVWGNSGHDQSGGALALHQGKLEMKNGGTIENAECGAMACARSTGNVLDMSKTGGIIIADQSNFKNCSQGVLLMPWPDPNNNLSLNTVNKSRFKRTNFVVNSDYPGAAPFESHVAMWRVYGINFEGCTFENLKPDAQVSGSNDLGQGISALDARFNVFSACPCNQYIEPGHVCYCPQRSRFEGLDHAIEAGDALTARGFSVTETDFVNNICGVYANGVINPVVKNNHFTMGRRAVGLTNTAELHWARHRAVFTTESYGTRIDDNQIDMDANALSEAEGVVVGYVRDHNDVVFRNHVTGLHDGYVGEGTNADPDNKTHVGLTWLCNDNLSNGQDLYNRYPDGLLPDDQPDATVRTIQGAQNRPADNTFNNTNPQGDFMSDNQYNNIVYWYRNDGQLAYQPIEVTPSYVAPQGTTTIPANNCARRFLLTHVIGDHPTGTLANGMSVLNSSKLAYGTTRYLYDQLIDGGSTDEVVQEIMQSWPSDAWELRNSLLAKSPYLSTEVLEEAVEKNIMPQAMLTEVLVANPEATQRDGFLRWVQSGSSHPLPQYLVDLVVASWNVRTYRFTLESTMAGHHTYMTMAADLILAEYQRDTIQEPMDSLRAVWQIMRTRSARYAEALIDLQQHNFAAALTVVQNIPTEHELRGPAEVEQQRMLNMITFIQDVYATGRDETALTTAEISTLESIVNGEYDRPAAWAQNLLCFGYGHCRTPLTGGDGSGAKRALSVAEVSSQQGTGIALWAQPNPAGDYTTLFYKMTKRPLKGVLVVLDILGREQARFNLPNEEGQVLWDTRSVQPGSYSVELTADGERLKSEQVIVKP
jgi:photosystem II stability/assembly factor-like uncharacterized protein